MSFTMEQRRRGGQTRCARLTPEQQAEYGRRGYAKTTELYGYDKWAEAVIARQRANPSRLERQVMGLLADMDWHLTHIYQPWTDSRATVDFADPDHRIAIEIRGRIHFCELAAPNRQTFFEWKVNRLRAGGWSVLVIDCPDNKLPSDTQQRLLTLAPTIVPF